MEASFDNAFPAKTDNRVKRMYVQEKRNMICSKDFRFFVSFLQEEEVKNRRLEQNLTDMQMLSTKSDPDTYQWNNRSYHSQSRWRWHQPHLIGSFLSKTKSYIQCSEIHLKTYLERIDQQLFGRTSWNGTPKKNNGISFCNDPNSSWVPDNAYVYTGDDHCSRKIPPVFI